MGIGALGLQMGACETQVIDDSTGFIIYSFATAWSPPIKFIEHVAREWPTLSFILDYDETRQWVSGCGKNA